VPCPTAAVNASVSGAAGPQRIRSQLKFREMSSSSMEAQAVAKGISAP
jgi:hypothetical protein